MLLPRAHSIPARPPADLRLRVNQSGDAGAICCASVHPWALERSGFGVRERHAGNPQGVYALWAAARGCRAMAVQVAGSSDSGQSQPCR